MDNLVGVKIDEFFQQYKSRKYPKGQILILNGDSPKLVSYIVDGHVKQYDVTYRGDEIVLNIFKPHTFFPMSVIMNDTENPYIYEADSPVELRQAPAAEVISFMKHNPDVVYDLLRRVYRGIDGILERLVHIMADSARNRVIYELIIEARRFGKVINNTCMLSLSEKDLGSRAGLSRETVNREVMKLKREKLLEIKNKGIFICDYATLVGKLNPAY